MNPLHLFLPEAIVKALGWTLLHSLWQGALLAVLLSLLLLVLHRHSARIRYRVASLSMGLLLVMAGITFFQVYEPATAGQVTSISQAAAATTTQAPMAVLPEAGWWATVTHEFQGYFGRHLPLIVTVWLLGLTAMLLRLVGGWAYTRRLRSYHLKPLPLEWQQRVQILSQKLGLKKLVQLAESGLVKVPAVVGHLQPIILLPLGTAAGLSPAQLEAILAHELAHVSRHDYLMNLLQCVVEALFFFHPAVWWISENIRAEREHCCDDLALTLCDNSLTYAYALTNLEEILMKKPVSNPQLAMTFSGKKRSLLSRIKRLVQGPSLRPSFSEGFMAACVLMVGILLFSVSAMAYQTETTPKKATATPPKAVPAKATPAKEATTTIVSVPAPEKQTQYVSVAAPAREEGTRAQYLQQGGNDLIIVRNKKGKIIELYVNGKKIPSGQISQYQSEIDASLNRTKNAEKLRDKDEVSRAMNSARSELARVERRSSMGQGIRRAPFPPMPPMPPMAGFGQGGPGVPPPPAPPAPPVSPMSPDGKVSKKDQARYDKEMKAYEVEMKKFEAEMEKYGEEMGQYASRMGTRVGGSAEALARRHAAMAERNGRLAEEAGRRVVERERIAIQRNGEHERRMKDHEKRMEAHNERMKKHEAMMKELKAELVKDGFIKTPEGDYTFKLDKTGLYVNDKKQSDSLYQKYKKLISKAQGEDIDITLKKDGSNFTINQKRETKD
ncbi:M56 family metallopeptidase [Rufibacter radiotolerans]|uniref:M56 family metallopeptidase n=1 Tax=Rufibacter radiotolerans TaxID=1379910 RepID=UPI000664619A|nr:M56 family metallopeptidase [Rufibacter radiotolerans]